MKIVWLGVLICGSLWAQPVYVYSEFVTINAQGKVTVPARPREILSPAIVRNAFASFQVVIEAEASMPWFLHVGLNPEQAVQVTLYRLKANQVLEKGRAFTVVERVKVLRHEALEERTSIWANHTDDVARLGIDQRTPGVELREFKAR